MEEWVPAFAGKAREDLMIAFPARFLHMRSAERRPRSGSRCLNRRSAGTGLCCRDLFGGSGLFPGLGFFRHLSRRAILGGLCYGGFRRCGLSGLASPFLAFAALRGEQR